MDIVQLVVIGMVLTILATVTLAAVSYGAFKMRERKKPSRAEGSERMGPLFFERVRFLPREDVSPAD
jgi:hypothetical protein